MDEELTPQQSERVRRLLADARHTGPTPDDVVARLDLVLAELASDPDSRPEPAEGRPVVRLDERRRRAKRLLLAAAAVVVGGVAIAPLVSGEPDGSAGSRRSSATTDQGLAAPERDAEGQDGSGSDAADPVLPGAISETRQSISRLPAQLVRPDRFATDARQLRQSAVASRQDAAELPDRELQGEALPSRGDRCPPGAWGGGRYLRVAFDREAGWLVYRPPRGATQVVDLFLCGEDTAERSTTLPHR